MTMILCSSCGERPALRGHDLCAGCDEGALADVPTEPEEEARDATLAVWFTPSSIREAFDLDDDFDNDPRKAWVRAATDDDLVEVARYCLDAESLWRLFHQLVYAGVEAAMPSDEPASSPMIPDLEAAAYENKGAR